MVAFLRGSPWHLSNEPVDWEKMVISDRNREIERYLVVWRFYDENADQRFPAEPIDSDERYVIPGIGP
jgi:hypothetical protein